MSEQNRGTLSLAFLATFLIVLISVRRRQHLRLSELGLRGSPIQGRVGGVAIAAVVILFAVRAFGGGFQALAVFLLLSLLLWLFIASRPDPADPTGEVRHRLLASRLGPALLTLSSLLSILTLATQPLDAAVARRIVEESATRLPVYRVDAPVYHPF